MSSHPIFYLAYGSNLSPTQMYLRCPSSNYIGIARLPHYRWIINERGYANVVASAPLPTKNAMGLSNESEKGARDEDEVGGLVYELEVEDGERLDGYEGVPWAYQKKTLEVETWLIKGGQSAKEKAGADRTGDDEIQDIGLPKPGMGSKSNVLVYIDTLRAASGIPKDRYVLRMRRSLREGIEKGLPRAWVESVIGKYIPLDEEMKEGVARV